MRQNEKKGHGGKHTRPKKWSGARRPAGPATTALVNRLYLLRTIHYTVDDVDFCDDPECVYVKYKSQ